MNPYKEILRKFFSKYVSTLRKRRGLTQEEMAAKKALRQSGKFIPWQVVTVTVDGRLKED